MGYVNGIAEPLPRLIAIMLERLKMSVDDCITAYLALSDRVFRKVRYGMMGKNLGRFNAEELAWWLKEVVKQQGLPEAVLLKDILEEAGCRA
jgi:hypothetical protein